MELVADILLVAGALGAGLYCFVLARRLNRFNDLEKGVGGAVAVLSAQVDDLTKTLVAAQNVSTGSNTVLNDLTTRAESVANRLELMMASLHDLPASPPVAAAPPREASAPKPTPVQSEDPVIELPQDAVSKPKAGIIFKRHDRAEAGASR